MPGCIIVGGVACGPAQVQGGDGEGTHSTGVLFQRCPSAWGWRNLRACVPDSGGFQGNGFLFF